MGFVDWRIGAWLFLLGLLGVLLPTLPEYTPPGGAPATPLWPFYVLLAVGAVVTGIGVHNALKKRKGKQR
jgi:peptidoglycan/LPS O-acetylase OafA/YrhL